MAEDVYLQGYDEELGDNPFFKYLQTKQKQCFDEAALKRWTVCIPRNGTLARGSFTLNHVENHLLQPIDGKASAFKTLNNKEVQVSGEFIVTTEGFQDVKTVRILFEETFFNSTNQSFPVLCLDQPLEGGIGGSLKPAVTSLESLQACCNFLWSNAGNKQTQKQIDGILMLFNATYQQLEGESLRHLMDAAHAIYTRAMQTALKSSHLKRLTRSNSTHMDNVKLAIETYVMNGLHDQLFKGISSIVGNDDALLNKTTRNLAEIQVKDLGIKENLRTILLYEEVLLQVPVTDDVKQSETIRNMLLNNLHTIVKQYATSSVPVTGGGPWYHLKRDLYRCMYRSRTNLPRGRRALSFLNRFTTPLEKFHCLKKTVTIVTDRKMKSADDTDEAITVDDLLPALIFLVIKSDIPNWLANITFLHNFHFSKRGHNEFQFFLSSIEAAVEHVRGGSVNDILKGLPPAKRLTSPWSVMETDGSCRPTALERLFQFVADGNEEEVEKLLSNAEKPGSPSETFCHPLCSCDNCEKLHSRKRHDPSAVTVFSRDELGRTILHVSSEYGHSNLALNLIKRGAVVNAMDYHGTTALHLACQRGHSSAALVLLHYKADVNAPDNDGNTPFHLCSANGHEKCAKALIYFDMPVNVMKVNAANEHGDTPLHLASRWGYVELVSLLLEKGASLEARNKDKATPLDSSHNKLVSELLLNAGVAHMEHEQAALALNDASSSESEVQLIQTQDFVDVAIPEDQDKLKEVERFIRTVADGDVELVRYKLGFSDDEEEDEEDLGEQTRSDQDLCHPLCQCDKCSKWQKLSRVAAEKTIHANVRNKEGMTALHVTAIRGYEEMTNLLLRRGAQTDIKNYTRMQTPLHLACQYNNPRVAGLLLSHQAKVNVKDYKGNTPLHLCCFCGNLDPANVLLLYGASVNVVNDRGNTPLHEAARFNFVKLVYLLLENGASVTIRNKRQLTPLQYAQRDDVIRALDQAEGISFNTQAEKLSYSSYDSHKTDESIQVNSSCGRGQLNSSLPKSRSKSVPLYGGTNDSPKQPLPVTSPPMASRVGEVGEKTAPPQERLNKLFERLERGEIQRLQDIGKAVRSFDRRTSLKRATTIDRSSPLLDLQLKHQLSIQHFDHSTLRKAQTRDRSQPMIDMVSDHREEST